MKPRRENGAVFVSPMTSGVSNGSAGFGSAVIGGSSAKLRARIQQRILCERKPSRGKNFGGSLRNKAGGRKTRTTKRGTKKQGRRSSMTQTTFPAPDI